MAHTPYFPRGTSLNGYSVRDFFRTKGLVRIWDGFFLKTKGFSPKVYEIFGSETPLVIFYKFCFTMVQILICVNVKPTGHTLLVGDRGGSDTFWICETLLSIPLGTPVQDQYIFGVANKKILQMVCLS